MEMDRRRLYVLIAHLWIVSQIGKRTRVLNAGILLYVCVCCLVCVTFFCRLSKVDVGYNSNLPAFVAEVSYART